MFFSSLKITLRGLRTRAIPAGVTALRSPGLVFISRFLLQFININPAEEIYGDSCGRKGLDETTECVSTKRAQHPPTESEVYFRSAIIALKLFKKYFTVYIFCALFLYFLTCLENLAFVKGIFMKAYFAFLEPLIFWSAILDGESLNCTYAVRKNLYFLKLPKRNPCCESSRGFLLYLFFNSS